MAILMVLVINSTSIGNVNGIVMLTLTVMVVVVVTAKVLVMVIVIVIVRQNSEIIIQFVLEAPNLAQ